MRGGVPAAFPSVTDVSSSFCCPQRVPCHVAEEGAFVEGADVLIFWTGVCRWDGVFSAWVVIERRCDVFAAKAAVASPLLQRCAPRFPNRVCPVILIHQDSRNTFFAKSSKTWKNDLKPEVFHFGGGMDFCFFLAVSCANLSMEDSYCGVSPAARSVLWAIQMLWRVSFI